ncbi:MAG: alanine--glyoxylate aminotransferase family protein [Candidatus Thermoplasmatota archaeon]|nr:alanine--glyoxylate aminotransferase family protein [Candidatus Thermoplasmatota archaeon]
MVRSETHKRLFIPGPTEVREEVLEAQAQWMIGHRSKEFSELYGGIIEKVKKFLDTDMHTCVYTSSGTGLMEAAIRNGVDKRVLCCVNGAFSERWAKIAEACGKEVDRLEFEWGKAVKPEAIEKKLEEKEYEAVTIVQNETSTGVRAKLEELSPIVKKHGALLLVDTVSSLGGDNMDVNLADMVLTSSQKCFALPPGLAICTLSDAMLEKSKKAKDKGYYFDLEHMIEYTETKKQTPETPAISLMFALDAELDYMLKEGKEGRYRRHVEMAEHVRNWAKKNFALFAEPGYESVTVTCVRNTKNIDVGELNKALKDMTISNGYGKLKGSTFRIAHMGDLTLKDVQELTARIDEVIS